jgi:hypothetical protein
MRITSIVQVIASGELQRSGSRKTSVWKHETRNSCEFRYEDFAISLVVASRWLQPARPVCILKDLLTFAAHSERRRPALAASP